MRPDIVAFTTVRQGNPSSTIEAVRAEVALDTMKQLQVHAIPCVVVYKDCDSNYLKKLSSLGAELVPEITHGMGNARREALQQARAKAQEGTYLLWLEPEKPDIPRYAEDMARRMVDSGSLLGLFNRSDASMDSYPSEQAHYYLFCRAVASALAGFDIDYAFGPMMLHRDATDQFLSYKGQYGDVWDSILVPRIPFIKQGLVTTFETDFKNDRRMTRIESGDTDIVLKRLQQFNNVIPSLIAEWRRF